MQLTAITHYMLNGFLLLIPILLWNALLAKSLPQSYSKAFFWKDIPSFIRIPENILRMLVFLLPVLMSLSLKTRLQKTGLLLYCLGILVYFLSWLLQIRLPESAWSRSVAGFLAPAYTPLLWLLGIGLIGKQCFLNIPHASTIYIVLAMLFLLFHCMHAYIVFRRIKRC